MQEYDEDDDIPMIDRDTNQPVHLSEEGEGHINLFKFHENIGDYSANDMLYQSNQNLRNIRNDNIRFRIAVRKRDDIRILINIYNSLVREYRLDRDINTKKKYEMIHRIIVYSNQVIYGISKNRDIEQYRKSINYYKQILKDKSVLNHNNYPILRHVRRPAVAEHNHIDRHPPVIRQNAAVHNNALNPNRAPPILVRQNAAVPNNAVNPNRAPPILVRQNAAVPNNAVNPNRAPPILVRQNAAVPNNAVNPNIAPPILVRQNAAVPNNAVNPNRAPPMRVRQNAAYHPNHARIEENDNFTGGSTFNDKKHYKQYKKYKNKYKQNKI